MRADPDTAFEKYGFFVTSEVYTNTTLGGPCAISCKSANGAVYQLTAKQGQGDYFFPYVHVTSGGVGVCIVPVGQAEGTMVVTGGMNGCALQVNRSGTDFYFYHDANGTSMMGKLTPGTVVCRVNYDSYAGKMNLGDKISTEFNRAAVGGKSGMVHEYYLITIRSGGKWKVYSTALLRTSVRKTAFWSGKDYNDITFAPFMPTYSRLITSFKDS
jgi:hypothetical protein